MGTPNNIFSTEFGIILSFTRTEIFEVKEVYGFVSFVSEFGGALGLFLGFSFLTGGDGIEPVILMVYQRHQGYSPDRFINYFVNQLTFNIFRKN